MKIKVIRSHRPVFYVVDPTPAGDYTVHAVLDNHTLGPALSFCPNKKIAKREARRLYRNMERKN